ncbi:hypothetical protein KFE25_007164 [Diacronema lutheri]|uniref:Uncharacterized protein n=1 Tax=Diacronema lutheri TaxID=2081491 RepID=A0A8J6CAX5_DIALT|nr:hypothetical protein KFE25_007164 [Diacronema lutheri]
MSRAGWAASSRPGTPHAAVVLSACGPGGLATGDSRPPSRQSPCGRSPGDESERPWSSQARLSAPRRAFRPNTPISSLGTPVVHRCGTASLVMPSVPNATCAPTVSRPGSAIGVTASLFDGAPSPFARPLSPFSHTRRPGTAPAHARAPRPGPLATNPARALSALAQPSPLDSARLAAASTVNLAPVERTRIFRPPIARPGDELDELARIKLAARAAFRGPERAMLREARRLSTAAADAPQHAMRVARIDRHALVWGLPLNEADSALISAGTLTDSAYAQVHGSRVLALQEALEGMQQHLWRAQAYAQGVMIGDDGKPHAAPPFSARARRGSDGSKGALRRRLSLPSQRRGRRLANPPGGAPLAGAAALSRAHAPEEDGKAARAELRELAREQDTIEAAHTSPTATAAAPALVAARPTVPGAASPAGEAHPPPGAMRRKVSFVAELADVAALVAARAAVAAAPLQDALDEPLEPVVWRDVHEGTEADLDAGLSLDERLERADR